MPRPAPDLQARREQVVRAARDIAESEGWPAVTMRRVSGAIGVTQPVLYSVFDGRQALIDAVALEGYEQLAIALEAVEPAPLPRMTAYLRFAAAHPRIYEAMFSMPSGLAFAAEDTQRPLRRAFAAVEAAFPGEGGTRAEVAWSTLHGLATLEAGERLSAGNASARLDLAHRLLTAG